MQRRYGWRAQRRQKVEDVRAVIAAEDAVLVLDGYEPHVGVVDELGRPSIVGLDRLPDLVFDLTRVLVLTSRIAHRDGHWEYAIAGGADRRGEIAGEGSDAASARRIGPDERNRQGGVHRFQPDIRGATRGFAEIA